MRRSMTLIVAGLAVAIGNAGCVSAQPATGAATTADAAARADEAQAPSAEQRASKVQPAASSVELRHRIVSDDEGRAVAQVGAKAPDFTLNAYHQGAFKQVSLADYRGQWVVLCFYPGDFTFV